MIEYEITSNTCALIGISDEETEIIEKESRFIVKQNVHKLLNNSCEFYGSTLEGRIKGSQVQLGMKYKLPIMIESSNELIFFPTISPRLMDCSWISLKNIQDYKAHDFGTMIEFSDDNKITIPISIESLENQIYRATKLMLISRKRREMPL